MLFWEKAGGKQTYLADFSASLHQLMTQMRKDKHFDKEAVFSCRRVFLVCLPLWKRGKKYEGHC